jgi:putative phosphoesterase
VKIGVVSDTHLREANDYLRRISEEFFSDAQMVLHAGDLVDTSVLKAFAGREVRAVRGNMDRDESLPERLIIEAGGVRIGLIHGWGMPFGIEAKLLKQFDNIDCLVYGHTHSAANHVKDGVLLFNPGSPTDRVFASRNTVGILEVGGGSVTGRILEINRKEFV